jgi:PadR family transcriptional regulator, regulatory protein AphA
VARVNPTEFAILGLLAEEARSGYDIKKEVEERLGHFWSESFGHIYPMLRRLHERGLVERTVERQEGRPDRKVYSVTDEGRGALQAWFAEPPPPGRPRNEVLLRIFLGRHGDPEHLIRDVREQKERFTRTLAQLRAVQARLDAEAGGHPDRVYWDLTLRYGLKALEALVEWSDEAESTLEGLAAERAEGRSRTPEPRSGRGRPSSGPG